MNWYIITKQKMTPRQEFLQTASNKIGRLCKLFKAKDVFDPGDRCAGAYDRAPQLIVKSRIDYPDANALTPLIEDLSKDKVVYAVLADDARTAIQDVYMRGLIYSGEREALNAQCPKETPIKQPFTMPIFYKPGAK